MISVSQLTKTFSGQTVLKNISLTFQLAHSYALVGPNGSGKTTLIKCILGLVNPNSGQIKVNELDISNQVEYRNHIGYMPQIGRYPDHLKVGQLIEMITNIRTKNSGYDHDLIDAFRIKDFQDKPMYSLSGGMRQKVGAALAFLFSPKMLILDEPSAGLDPFATEILKEKILKEQKNGKLILITSHNLAELDELTEELVCLVDGEIRYEGTIDGMKRLTHQDTFSRALANLLSEQNDHKSIHA